MAIKGKKASKQSRLMEALIGLAVVVGSIGLIFGIFMLSTCERDEPAHKTTLIEDDIDFVWDNVAEKRYMACNAGMGAEKVYTEDGPYMTLKYEGKTLNFYPIKSQPKEKFVALKKDGSYILYRSENVESLTISAFDPVSADIYLNGFSKRIDQFLYTDVADKNDAEDGTKYVQLIKSALMGTALEDHPTDWQQKYYGMRLYSKAYPGIYYEVLFKVSVDGRAYLYDRVYHKYFAAPEELVARVIG